MRKTERLVAITLLLQARGKMTAERLGTIMGVSTRTIYRDMDTLSLAHVPVAMDYGPGGGYDILAMDLEGTEVCDWLNAHGITAVLLKYRVPSRSARFRTSPRALEDALGPEMATLPLVVAALENVIHPTEAGLGADPLEPRIAVEHTGEDEVGDELRLRGE